MKILLLFLTVVCAVQANYIIQVKQEVGGGGCGHDKEGGRGDGGEQGEEGGEGEGGGEGGGGGGGGEGGGAGGGEGLGGGEGGGEGEGSELVGGGEEGGLGGFGGEGGGEGGSGSSELVNQLNDLQTQLNDLETQLEIAEDISFQINDFLSMIPDILMTLDDAIEFEEPCGVPPEPPCPPGRHRRSAVVFDNCNPSVDLNGDLGVVIKNIITALFTEMPDAVISQEPTTFKCYLTRLFKIVDDLQRGVLKVKQEYIDAIKTEVSGVLMIAEQQLDPANEVIETIKADIADIRTQIAEKEAAIEEAESSDDE